MKSLYIGFIGKGNCGKGTQAKILADKYNLKMISTGSMLRDWVLKEPDNFFAKKLNEDIDNGILVPSAVVFYLWFTKLMALEPNQGIVFEGSPRMLIEAQAMEEIFKWMGNNNFLVFNLNIPDEESYNRSMNRRYCPKCHKTYSLAFDPGISNCKDDNTELIVRDDDKPEVIKRRIDDFNEFVIPTIEFLKSKGVLYGINGVGPVDTIAENIDKIIQEKINQ